MNLGSTYEKLRVIIQLIKVFDKIFFLFQIALLQSKNSFENKIKTILSFYFLIAFSIV